MMLGETPAWYVVCAHREYRVRDDLQELGFEVWLPECQVVRTTRRSIEIKKSGALFPGYLFLHAEMRPGVQRQVEEVRWVDGMLRCGDRLAQIPDRVMAALQELVTEAGGRVLIKEGRVLRGYGYVPTHKLPSGTPVRVLEGPFAGLDALYDAPNGRDRVNILLDIMGRRSVVSVPEAAIEAAA